MIQVEEIILRVPGMGAAEARLMTEAIASSLAERLPDQVDNGEIGELNIKLSLSPETGSKAMGENIVTQILQQLNLL